MSIVKNKTVPLVFGLSWVYWIYLYATTEFVVLYDAIGYENLAGVIYKEGWVEFFRIGPNREPLYPWLIAVAMRLGDALGISYGGIIKVFQLLLLGITQYGTYLLLKSARVREGVAAAVLLYLGISPGVLNAALSLFSEIAAMPFVVFAIWICIKSLDSVPRRNMLTALTLGGLFGIMMFLATTVKGIFEYVFWVMLLPFVYAGVKAVWDKSKDVCRKYAGFILAAALMASVGTHTYKFLNHRYNGNYVFTNRGMALLYGNTMKRTNALSPRSILAHVANIPGQDLCLQWFTAEECRYAEYLQADHYRLNPPPELRTGLQKDLDAKLKAVVIERFKLRPFQFISLTLLESLRMFFWESTRIGFVNYPSWLQALYLAEWFSDGLRAVVSLASLLAFAAALWFTLKAAWTNRRGDGCLQAEDMRREWHVVGMIVVLIASYTALYSLFSIVARYALVIAPLYLVLIGWVSERWLKRKERLNR